MAASGVAMPSVSMAAAASVIPASSFTVPVERARKYQLHCQGWSFIRHTFSGRCQPSMPKKASASRNQTRLAHVKSAPAQIRTSASGSGSAGVNQKRFHASSHSPSQ